MALVSPVVPRARVLQGTLVLLLALVLGPILSWKLCIMLWPARWTILATVAFAELCFYRCYYLSAYQEHNRIPKPCRPKGFTDADGKRLWRRFIALAQALPDGINPQEYLSQWFCNAPFEAIKRGNVEEMLTYGFFYKKQHELGPDMRHFPAQMVSELEKALRVKFAPGKTPDLKFMDHLWDELRANYRPLCMYVVMEFLYYAQRLIMAGYGFHHRVRGQLGYYTLNCGLDAATYNSKHSSDSNHPPSRSRLDRFFDSLLGYIQGGEGGGGAPGPTTAAPDVPPPANNNGAAAEGGVDGDDDELCGVDSATASLLAAASNAESIDYTPFADPAAAAAAEDDGAMGGGAGGGRGGGRGGRQAPPQPPPNPLEAALPKGETPVMFLHGVGGLMLYLEMLKHVIALGHPVIVVEYKHVAMRLSSYIPSVDELTRNVVDILEFEGIPKVCVVGHSYGSFVASRLNMKHREYVHSMCVIDPVALGMFMPHLLHNFMYRRPRVDLKRPDILLRDLVLWFASRDVHLSATFSRNFYWTEINMWPDDLPAGSCIILSGNDDLCNAEGVEEMCKLSGHVRVIVNPDLFHGAFLLSRNHKADLMREVRNLLATSGSLVVHMARPVLAQTISAARSLLHEVETLTSRLSISPQPFGSAAGGTRNSLEGRPSGGLWSRMSQGLTGSMSRKTSVPIPRSPSPVDSVHGSGATIPAARSPSAPPLSPSAGAARVSVLAQKHASAPAQPRPPSAAAAASDTIEFNPGSPPGGADLLPALAPTAAGWWGAAAAAAAAECDQQPSAAVASQSKTGSKQQQPQQLSVIMSGPEISLAELPDAAAGSGVKVSAADSSFCAAGDDWVITDQDPGSGSGGCGSGGILLNPLGSSKKSLHPIQEHLE